MKRHFGHGVILGAWFLITGSLAGGEAAAADSKSPPPRSVRPPQVAGSFYPADPGKLRADLKKYLAPAARPLNRRARAIIAPHAGYEFDYPAFGAAYRSLEGKPYRRVFILASNHSRGAGSFKFAIPGYDKFATPLGQVKVDPLTRELVKPNMVETVNEPHMSHIIEVQLPFLQYLYKDDFAIIPIVTGRIDREDITWLADRLSSFLDDDTLIIVSSDLSHYYPYKEAQALDEACTKAIVAQNINAAEGCEACGRDAILVLLGLANQKGWEAERLSLINSGDTSGMKEQVVGYTAIRFYDETFDQQTRTDLLEMSRLMLKTYLKDGKAAKPKLAHASRVAQRERGCFVTLKKNNELRGCIGSITPTGTLVDCVAQNTINAAVHDPRFVPVTKSELKDLRIEISVLSPPRPVSMHGRELENFLVPGKHGVIISQGDRSATYLPQVWEDLPDKTLFLSTLCKKGMMKGDCWMDSGSSVFIYEALHFAEPR
ncbi:MAG: AmmeMemoRadiSam system protein B [Oligoflexales bacterium]|nr:AmmeMemoRadiSam system protein B [Oligoflexales bacterium]